MFMQKQQNGMSSCSSASSLSNIALRNRTVSRDSILYFSEDNALCDSVCNIQTNGPKKISCKRRNKSQKCCTRKEPLRKLKKAKRNISKKPKWQIQNTIVVAPFHALKESFQNQIKEICGKKTNGFKNKNVAQVETLVPILREDFTDTDKNSLKRKRCSTSPDESNYCDCMDDSSKSLSEDGAQIQNLRQAEIDLRNDSDGSSIILELERLNKKPKKCLTKGDEDAFESKPSHSQNKRRRKIKGNFSNAERGSKSAPRTKKNNKNMSNHMKKSCDADNLKKTCKKWSQPRYHTRSVTKKEKEKKDRLLKMMRAQNEIITKLEDFESSGSSKDQPCEKKKIGDVQTEDESLTQDQTASDPTQKVSNEPPCVVLHPFDPFKRKAEGNLSDYSSDESICDPSHDELEETKKFLSPNSKIQSEKHSLDNQENRNLENNPKEEDQGSPKKKFEGFSINSLEKSSNPYAEPFLSLGAEGTSPNTNNIEEPAAKTPENITDDCLLNFGIAAEKIIEPSVIVQEHYNEPSSVGSSSSGQHEDYEPQTCNSPNRLELPSFCCSVQEPDQQNDLSTAGYIFGPRNDFSRLRESCEFSFGLSGTIQDDQESDTGAYFELSRD